MINKLCYIQIAIRRMNGNRSFLSWFLLFYFFHLKVLVCLFFILLHNVLVKLVVEGKGRCSRKQKKMRGKEEK